MKGVVKLCLLAALLPLHLMAQRDSTWLTCPLNEATIVPPPKNAIRYDPPDLCVALVSVPDTVVKACFGGRITNLEQTEDGKWDVVFNYKNYYFWYSGLGKIIVKRNENLKAGQPVGYIAAGEKIELLMFNFETPLDPTKYLDCKRMFKSGE